MPQDLIGRSYLKRKAPPSKAKAKRQKKLKDTTLDAAADQAAAEAASADADKARSKAKALFADAPATPAPLATGTIPCPVCQKPVVEAQINLHLGECPCFVATHMARPPPTAPHTCLWLGLLTEV